MVRRVNSNVYIFVSMTLNTTHVRGNGGYNGGMTLKLSRCVRIMYLHMCAKFQVSMVNSCRENPDWGGFRFSKVRFSFKFSSKFRRVLSSCFSTSMFQIDFLFLLMTGANNLEQVVQEDSNSFFVTTPVPLQKAYPLYDLGKECF